MAGIPIDQLPKPKIPKLPGCLEVVRHNEAVSIAEVSKTPVEPPQPIDVRANKNKNNKQQTTNNQQPTTTTTTTTTRRRRTRHQEAEHRSGIDCRNNVQQQKGNINI